MDEHNTDSDSHSVTSNQSTSSGTSSKPKQAQPNSKETSVPPAKPVSSKRRQDEEGRVASTPKRKKTDGADATSVSATTPGSSTRKAAPLSERQQMALALAMSAQESGGTSPSQSTPQPAPAPDSTPRTALLRKVNRRNEKGESPLHLATIRGDVEGMKKLLKAGAGVNVPDYAGWTALHEACNHGFVSAAKLLLRKGATVNAQGLDNDTPLHDAAINGHPELVALLLKYGANPYQANSKGESPLDVAINDDIIKLLRKETVYKLVSDESDTPASSPESLLPKEGASELISSASTSTESSATVSEQTLSNSRPAEEAVRKPSALHQQPSAEYEAFRSGGAMSTLPLAPSGGGGDQTVRSVSPVIQQQQQSVPRPLSAGRPASTGFTQYAEADRKETPRIPSQTSGRLSTSGEGLAVSPPETSSGGSSVPIPDVTAAGVQTAGSAVAPGMPSGAPPETTTPAGSRAHHPEVITVQPETLLSSSMEGVVPVQSIDTSTLANKARQSLDFKPISVPPTEVTSHSTPVSDATPVAPLVTPPTHPSSTIPHSQLPAGTTNTAAVMSEASSKPTDLTKPSTSDDKTLSLTGATAATAAANITSSTVLPAVPAVPSQESLESEDLPQPTTLPFSSVSNSSKEPADNAKLPLTAAMSTGFSDMMSSRNTTPPVSDGVGSTPTAASLTGGKEEKKRAEKPSTPDITKDSKPASPAPDKRTRTGSMHRKRKQAHTPQPTTVDPPTGTEGDNSLDSTDSHMSSNSSGTTRSSRSRNKQSNTQQPQQQSEEEQIPVRETRRKAMLKERAAANSPSGDKQARGVGSQKVPPLTIKLGCKSPVNTTTKDLQTSSTNTATTTTMSSLTTSAATAAAADPYVMLPDRETEKANSALSKEQESEDKSPQDDTQDSAGSSTSATGSTTKERKERSTTPTPSSSSQSSSLSSTSSSSNSTSTVTTVSSSGGRRLRSHTTRNQAAAAAAAAASSNTGSTSTAEKREVEEPPAPPRKSKRMKQEATVQQPVPPPAIFPPAPGPMTIFNPYNLFKDVREQMCKKWERIVTVHPRTPAGYPNYLINTKKYLLLKNSSTNASKLAIPLLAAPAHLNLPMKEFFDKQEQDRYKLRQQHIIEGEKLRIAYEQEIVRVYTRGARAAANQETPLSVCTVLKDKESGTVYHPYNALKDGNNGQQTSEEKHTTTEGRTNRSHFNNRQLLSWLQDSEDKFEKLKDQMLSRHHHEAESLYAVQTMNWEWKLKECGLCDYKSQPSKDQLHVPMVHVNDDADILNSA